MPSNIQFRRSRLAAQIASRSATTGAGSDRAALDVSRLDSWLVREPVSGRAWSVVKVEVRSGLAGWGECLPLSSVDLAAARKAIEGMPATSYEPIRRDLLRLGPVQAGVNLALLDILGKFAKVPVYQLLGGPTRHKVRALAPLAGGDDRALRTSLERARAAGHKAFLVPLPPATARNQGQAFVKATVRRLEILRSAAGPATDFVLDGAASLSPSDAANLATALERFHLLWFDEPCPAANLAAIRKIAAENVTPIGWGRHIVHGAEAMNLMREEVADVLRPDIGRSGITQIRRISTIAETHYTAVAPFHDGGPIATAAALHLAASLPNFFIQQAPLAGDEKDSAMRNELTGPGIETVKDGFFALPPGPGLGVEVSASALEKYRERAI